MSDTQPAAPAGAADVVKLALIGFMGAGKSTAVGALGAGALDVDAVIEERGGRSVAEIFAADGEAAFRELEADVTVELLTDPAVKALSLGGGAVLSERITAALADARVVWLDLSVEQAWARVSADPDARPLARDRQRFERLYRERRPLYEQLANVIVPGACSRALPQVRDALAGLPRNAATVLWATTESGDYPVYVGSGLVSELRFWPETVRGRRVVISDQNVAPRYAGAFNPSLTEIEIIPGERSKNLAGLEAIWTQMVQAGANRGDVVVALGGGVVGDMAGFCAASYQRGMRVVQVPTSLLAQVDSAYGGKTGVDLAQAKNYIGAFHQPSAVIVDPATLASLPPEEFAAGYAEVVKTALIAGGSLWQRLSGGTAATDAQLIADCARAKLAVVAADEHDTGTRQLLNLGHTVAHAIEAATAYTRYRHGEAVALGLLAELRLSGADRLRDEVRLLLEATGLPVALDPTVDLDQVMLATTRDKKRVGEAPVPFVLCEQPGNVQFGRRVPDADVRAAIQELYP